MKTSHDSHSSDSFRSGRHFSSIHFFEVSAKLHFQNWRVYLRWMEWEYQYQLAFAVAKNIGKKMCSQWTGFGKMVEILPGRESKQNLLFPCGGLLHRQSTIPKVQIYCLNHHSEKMPERRQVRRSQRRIIHSLIDFPLRLGISSITKLALSALRGRAFVIFAEWYRDHSETKVRGCRYYGFFSWDRYENQRL